VTRAPTHAGGIVLRPSPTGPLFLVVQASRDPAQWVLPKGHVEAGETLEETAVRELREEAGVDGDIVATVGDADFVAPRGRVHTRFFLMRHRADVEASELRAIAWLPYEQARARLSFDDQRRLLERARELLSARGE
jgi:8-oxo-dGTP pyrophosphatase MutT (NUDIX family)